MKEKLIFILHHFIRTFWALYTIRLFVWTKLKRQMKKDHSKKLIYEYNKNIFDKIKSLEELKSWYKLIYRYKWDSLIKGKKRGWFDRDATKIEFFIGDKDNHPGGDCDDMAYFAMLKLKEFGYKAKRIMVVGKCLKGWHYDCMFEKYGEYYLFNYGNLLKGSDKILCVNVLNIAWNYFWGHNITFIECNRKLEWIGGGITLSAILFILALIF